MKKNETIRYNACSLSKGQDAYNIRGIDKTESGYSISYYPESNYEVLTVYDMGEEIECIFSRYGKRELANSSDLEICEFQIKTNIYQNLSSDNQKKVLEIIKETLWSDHYTMTDYMVSKEDERKLIKKAIWSYTRKEKDNIVIKENEFIFEHTKQKQIASQVIRESLDGSDYKIIAGADVAYNDVSKKMIGAIVVLNSETMEVVEEVTHEMECSFPYIPGLFSFRETPVLIEAFKKLKTIPDLIVCDGHGVAHPKEAGLACHLGLELNIPTIGCAKKRLIGYFDLSELNHERGSSVDLTWNDKIIGKVLRTQAGIKPVFVSIGHKISLEDAEQTILKLATKYRLPETTRKADGLVNKLMKSRLEFNPYED
jgi:deoxyribonuclease V